MKTIILIPAHNEESSIAATLDSVMAQEVAPDKVVVIPNGCSDRTAAITRTYPVIVMELPALAHRKSEALNRAWLAHAYDADIVISMDADTHLPPHAVGDWIKELSDASIGGSSSTFTIHQPKGLLARLQKAEFAAWADLNLHKGHTTVLSGTGCALSNTALKQIAARSDRHAPWAYTSQVEDFELTYRIQELGYRTIVSPTVRAYTDSMDSIKSLWGQRMKWQVGTLQDLLAIGFNKHTAISWGRQALNALGVLSLFIWAYIAYTVIHTKAFTFQPLWLIIPAAVTLHRFHGAHRIPHKDKKDIALSLSFIPHELFILFRYALFIAGWSEIVKSKITKKTKDRWAIQYQAEGVSHVSPTQN